MKKMPFTLIELLVTIAIISILASILLPSLKQVRDRVKSIDCINNLKQFGIANMMYACDYKDWIPYSRIESRLWDYLLMPYVEYPQDWAVAEKKTSFSIYHCPSGGLADSFSSLSEYGNYRRRGYGYNYYSCYRDGAKIINYSRPSEVLLMSDWCYGGVYGDSEAKTFSKTTQAPFLDMSGYSINFSYRHNGGTNILFADGHVDPRKKGTPTVESGWLPLNILWSYNY